jgi:hypothetical protein
VLYVGSTGQSAQQRFEQHLRGEKSQWLKRQDIWRLRMELVLGVAPRATRAEAEAEEFALAERLAELGFETHCDGWTWNPGTPSPAVVPANHVQKIGPLVGRLVRELTVESQHVRAESDLVDVLHGRSAALSDISSRHEARHRLNYLLREQVATAVAIERRLRDAA